MDFNGFVLAVFQIFIILSLRKLSVFVLLIDVHVFLSRAHSLKSI